MENKNTEQIVKDKVVQMVTLLKLVGWVLFFTAFIAGIFVAKLSTGNFITFVMYTSIGLILMILFYGFASIIYMLGNIYSKLPDAK